MALLKLITLAFATSIIVEAKWHQHQKRETTLNICDPAYNITVEVQCYCITESQSTEVKSATCHLTKENIPQDHKAWEAFEMLQDLKKLTLSNTRGISVNYVPRKIFKYLHNLSKLDIKYGSIETVHSFSFSNMTAIEEITLSDNQIKTLEVNAFANNIHLLSIGLDMNNIIEINRNVFVGLPSLEKLFLTNNKITTIHDKAFVHLHNLKELELDRNSIFSLNSETFAGLKELQRLDLSANSLEVIGDNTFLPVVKLKTLNLERNKIQMLDEKAFNGLARLSALSLAHNKLTTIDNVKVFGGLNALFLLNLKSNQLNELKREVMAPILRNFYGNSSNLDVDDNNFPCDCRLEWFTSLMNKTQNRHLKISLENLKCVPDSRLQELWTKTIEAEKALEEERTAQEDEPQSNTDYEYYDDTQLNGKLFYLDIRDLINCTERHNLAAPKTLITKEINSSPIITKDKSTTTTEHLTPSLIVESTTTPKPIELNEINKPNTEKINKNKEATTVRLVTVSAKPVDHNFSDQDNHMASDEARPEKTKSHRSIQEKVKDTPLSNDHSGGSRNFISITFVSILLFIRIYLF